MIIINHFEYNFYSLIYLSRGHNILRFTLRTHLSDSIGRGTNEDLLLKHYWINEKSLNKLSISILLICKTIFERENSSSLLQFDWFNIILITILFELHSSAKSAFSDKKPKPG